MNMPTEHRLETVSLFIGGQRTASKSTRNGFVTNPATGAVIRHVPYCTSADVDAAVAAATAVLPEWSAYPALRRSRVMQKFLQILQANAKDLARAITEENGKTLADAIGEVQRGSEVIEFACGIPQLLKGEYSENVGPGVDCHTLRQSVGVCAGITPFNFPVMVPLWMFPVAIACGNTFILKPSEKDPSPAIMMAEMLKQAGLPDGVFNVVHGDKESVDAILAHRGISAVSFVGSTPIARYIYETGARHGKRVQALGGAKNHMVVLPDADVDYAAEAVIGAAYGAAGERCMAISVVVAVGEVADPLVDAIRARAERVRVGPGLGDGVDMGPLVTSQHRDKVASYVDSGIAEGATLKLDGRGVKVDGHDGHEGGFFLGATLFDNVTPDMKIYREEIFGPVLSVVRVATLEDAIALVNAQQFANGAAIFTGSGGAARRFQEEVQIGMIGINVPIPVPLAFYSFGGWKNSLFGDLHVHGTEAVKFYTRTKAVTSRWPDQGTPRPTFAMPVLG